MGWILSEERDTIAADDQDFTFRAYIGPPREQVIHANLQRDTPLVWATAMTKLTASLTSAGETVTVESTAAFPATGAFFIGTEFIKYETKTATTFTDLTRENPQAHASGAIARQFTEVTDYVTEVSLQGSIDQHEWTGDFRGVDYDHRLFQPDRSLYVEFRYFPMYGSPGPKVGAGFATTGVQVTELFTLKDADDNTVYPHGLTWTRDGQLWAITDDDLILRIDPTSGEVITTLTPQSTITDMEGVASSPGFGDDFIWIASAHPTVPTIYGIDRSSGLYFYNWIVDFLPGGITWDGTKLWILDTDNLSIKKFSITGTQEYAISAPDASPEGIAYWDGALYVLGSGNRLYRVNTTTGAVESIKDLPVLTDGKALALGTIGGRVGDATTGRIYELKLPSTVGRTDNGGTGEWSPWLPLYFGYIEQGSIEVDHLEKNWNLRTRSTWMYLGEKEADGRNLAPEAISNFRPTRCSSVLSDPALEINTEYISVPGEGVGCSNIVDDDMTTVWISQDIPRSWEGPDPIPGPIYGCMKFTARTQMSQASGVGSTQIFIEDGEGFPASGWIVIEPGHETREEVARYSRKWGNRALQAFVDANGNPTTLQIAHPKFSQVRNTFSDGTPAPCGRECPQINGRYCCDPTYSGYVPYNETGVVVPPWPGDSQVTADGSLARRLIFTEIYKPRLGLRPETSWWIELRNMSDRSHANLVGPTAWSPWIHGQGFLVIKTRNIDGEEKVVNLPLSILADQHVTIGPCLQSADCPGGKTCKKGWLVLVADRADFDRWWGVPFGVPVHELRFIPDSFPDFGGDPIALDFNRGELKYYWQNAHFSDRVDRTISRSISPTDNEIRIGDYTLFPNQGLGVIYKSDRRVRGEVIDLPYEWITWTGTEAAVDPDPLPGANPGFLTGVTRGVEGTKAREWTGDEFMKETGVSRVQDLMELAPGETIDNLTTSFGDDGFKLSDWVKFSEMPKVRHGYSYARLAQREPGWGWIQKKVPQPGEKLFTGRSEWFSIDLCEITPPTLEAEDLGTSTTIGLTGDATNLMNSGVVLIDQEYIKYNSIDRESSGAAPTVTATLDGLTRGYDGSTVASHEAGTNVWQVIDRGALVEHLVSGVSFHRKADAVDGIPTHYAIYITWRPTPRYPNQLDPSDDAWREDWQLIWRVSGNTQKNRGHFIAEFADYDSGAQDSRPPGTLGYYRARHVLMVIENTNSGRAKMNEFKVYGLNPRVNLLAGSLSEESGEDVDVSDMQNTIAVLFDYLVRGFGLSPDEIQVIGTGVNFYELPIASGSYQSIIGQLADATGYSVWFNRFNQLWFMPNPATRRAAPIMTDLDDSLMREPLEIISKPTGRTSQVIIYFRDELADETFEVRYPEEPRGLGAPLEFDNVVVASAEEAKSIAQQIYQEANGQWEVVARFGMGHHFILGHRYSVTYSDWEASDTYFQGMSFIVSGLSFNIQLGPNRRWDTDVTLTEYHISV